MFWFDSTQLSNYIKHPFNAFKSLFPTLLSISDSILLRISESIWFILTNLILLSLHPFDSPFMIPLIFSYSIWLIIYDSIWLIYTIWFKNHCTRSTHHLGSNLGILIHFYSSFTIQFHSDLIIQFESVLLFDLTLAAHIWLPIYDSNEIIQFNLTRQF